MKIRDHGGFIENLEVNDYIERDKEQILAMNEMVKENNMTNKEEGTKESAATLETEGRKNDKGKAPLSLIPLEALEIESFVFEFGLGKYGKSNYKKGMAWSRPLNAALRHINAWANGEDLDPESGLSHLGHARCCLAMLAFYQKNKKGKDDRLE